MVQTVADIFCGAGGFSEGFRHQGYRISFAVDIWRPATQTFKLNHPDCEVWRADVRVIDPSTLPRVDVVVGSPPCVEFSYAKGASRRNPLAGLTLVRRFFDIVETLKPRAWVMENVPALQSYVHALTPPTGAKWTEVDQRVLNSADFGVPQRRFRFFAGQYIEPRPSHR